MPTNNFQPWTQPEARNIGAKMARGEYLICTDIDHIVTCGLVETVRKTAFDVVRFKREVAILDETGEFTQDRAELTRWGFPPENGLRISAHGNSYAIKRELFLELGGSQQKAVYPNRDEVKLKRGIKKLEAAGKITRIPDDDRPYIYMFPNGRYSGDIDCNPFGFFHNLKRGDAVYNNTRVEYA